jgi:hypothetical protein
MLDQPDDTNVNLPATRRTIEDICKARDEALESVREAATTLDAGYALTAKAMHVAERAYFNTTCTGGQHQYAKPFEALHRSRFNADESYEAARKVIDARTWMHLVNFTGIYGLMDRHEKKAFDHGLNTDVPLVDAVSAFATLERLQSQAGLIFRRGIANVFSDLDRRFRSHNGFKLGSRIILRHAFSESGSFQSGNTRDCILDIERVFAALCDDEEKSPSIIDIIHHERRSYGAHQSEHEGRFFRLKAFKNGNAHLWFSDDKLLKKVNRLLAEYLLIVRHI